MKAIQFTVPVYGEDLFALLEDKKDNFYSYYHRHEELQITYILKGRGTIMIGNVVQSFSQDDIFILKPNEPHIFDKYGDEKVTDEDTIHAIHLFINLKRMAKFFTLAEFADICTYFRELDVSKRLDSSVAYSLRDNFLNLLHKVGIPKFTEFITLLHILLQYRNAAISLYSGIRNLIYSDKDGERISSVFKYTLDNFDHDISVGEVASLVYMTPTSFCKFFKKHTMKTYIGFLNEVRIEKACQLLMNKKTESISETAFKVGFNNIVHFNRVFKRIMGVSPHNYMRLHIIG
ncbi:AraC family transcriptional regulator [Sphingobacterium lumbrici]|uniref:AraC family transcriptional regulator n=1 Tax=Sphingobacterium lumbrici TaxID=2559600 RepID=UPI00112B53FA|nr:AraC family transcriptional regulator [Sphingobacterium lumbrici]